MFSTTKVMQPAISHSPDVLELQFSMCQMPQPQLAQPIARWIMEEGQLLGVLVASSPAPLCCTQLKLDATPQTFD